jgi:hypothetical protein
MKEKQIKLLKKFNDSNIKIKEKKKKISLNGIYFYFFKKISYTISLTFHCESPKKTI